MKVTEVAHRAAFDSGRPWKDSVSAGRRIRHGGGQMEEPRARYSLVMDLLALGGVGGSISGLLTDIAMVASLILLASFFVAAEIALISLRESQIRQMATRGRRGARVALLAENPNRFLAAVQVGVTVCGFLSAALGAERLGRYVEPVLTELGLSPGWSATISLIGLTLAIAYFSLVFGELVPKRLALYRTEAIALASAPIIDVIAGFFRPVIWLLSRSTNAVVQIFGVILMSNDSKCQKRNCWT